MNSTKYIEEQTIIETTVTSTEEQPNLEENTIIERPKKSFWSELIDWLKYEAVDFFVGLLILGVIGLVIWYLALALATGAQELIKLLDGPVELQKIVFTSIQVVVHIVIWGTGILKFLMQPGMFGMWDD